MASPVRDFKTLLTQHRAALAEQAMLPGQDGYALSERNAQFLDGVLQTAFADAGGNAHASLALVAVGSFGRGALTAHADVDVRLLTATSSQRAAEVAEAMLYPLWDAGLAVGHQVATASELLALFPTDLTTATALLDVRHIAGNPALSAELSTRAHAGPFAEANLPAFLDRLEVEAKGRHDRFGDSVYLLEPDVKNGAGGSRDLELALWAVKARFRPRGPGAELFAELVQLGAMVPREQRSMQDAREFSHRVRNHLHLSAGRRHDRLTFEKQEELADRLGFTDAGGADEQERLGQAVERMMQAYYREARVVSQARESLLARARPEPRRRTRPVMRELGGGLRIWDEHVTVADAGDAAREPEVLLRAIRACVEHEMPLWPHARDLVARFAQDAALGSRLRESPAAGAVFTELVASRADTPFRRSALAELHELGLLVAMVPEFVPVLGRVHHDLYHVYTVDVHSVAATDAVRAIARGEYAAKWPLATRVFSELDHPKPIFLAALLHDVGKGYPDASGSRKNHSESGAELVRTILPRLGEDERTTALVAKLVTEHLSMYHTATRRDLDDPATVKDFVARVGTREVLEHLYLLTLVDLSTTAPKALTSWKANLLDELYLRAAESFDGESRQADPGALGRYLAALPEAEARRIEIFAQAMPKRYRALVTPERIAAHAQLSAGRTGAFACAMSESDLTDTMELAIAADDSPGLLALVAAALTAGRLEVVAADVYSRETEAGSREAFDIFWVRDRAEGAAGARETLPRLEADLGALLAREVTPEALLERRRSKYARRGPPVMSEIALHGDASPEHTVVEVFGRDQPGLLYALARCLTQLGLGIERSRINTEGNRVADVFYVQEASGGKIAPARFAEIRAALLAVADAGHRS